MRDPEDSFREYIDKKMGDNFQLTLSLDEIDDDWNMTLKVMFYSLSLLYNYDLKRCYDFPYHITLTRIIEPDE